MNRKGIGRRCKHFPIKKTILGKSIVSLHRKDIKEPDIQQLFPQQQR